MNEQERKQFLDDYGQEELCDELKERLEYDDKWCFLRHPLVYSIPHSPMLNKRCNRMLRMKKEFIKKSIIEKDWQTILYMYERPYRLQAFTEYLTHFKDEEYWELLASIWVDSENIWQNVNLWKSLLLKDVPKREFFMDEGEREILKSLPDEITIYRGGRTDSGLSWTLTKEKAEWFANRIERTEVFERKIKKSQVFAFLARRGEDEIIFIEH